MSERPEASSTGSDQQATESGVTESGVTDEVTPDPGAAEAQEVPAEDALSGAAASRGSDEDLNTEAVNDPAEKPAAASAGSGGVGSDEHPDTRVARERLEDLQRLQAEYVNYKRRVDRDRALVQERAIADVLDSLLPVLDDIHGAREHGDLADGPFAAIADKLEASLGRFGLERFGGPGEAFDPTVHEALLHTQWDTAVTPVDPSATTVVQVLQPGYRTGERVIRPARVSVADPE
ncbi:MAG: nucleotide exchange factor GrpE [Intrasporangiaceae bacterium]|nr:nucleotide exchange factor GrpE [Intrasporangiaceae bacterium]